MRLQCILAVALFLSPLGIILDGNEGKNYYTCQRGESNTLFIENIGQWPDDVRFMAGTSFGTLVLCDDRIEFHWTSEGGLSNNPFSYKFSGSKPSSPEGKDPELTLFNYFLGKDPEKWRIGARSFRMVEYPNLWDRIDLVYYFTEGEVKYDLILHPGSDPNEISFMVEGHDSFEVSKKALSIESGGRRIDDSGLVSHDLTGFVESSFRRVGEDAFGFEVGMYDRSGDLIIDPTLQGSFRIGHNGNDECNSVLPQEGGLTYVVGKTESPSFPATDGSCSTDFGGQTDIFVSCIDEFSGLLVFSTFIGGQDMDFAEVARINGQGEIIVVGFTHSPDFPTTSGAYRSEFGGYRDIFLFGISAQGDELTSSTFMGGTSGQNFVTSMALTMMDEIVIVGNTASNDHPITEGAFDDMLTGPSEGFVTIVSPDMGSLVASTYLGGSGPETLNGVALDTDCNVWVCGQTWSADFPVSDNAYKPQIPGPTSGMVAILSPDLKGFVGGTYFGGSGYTAGIDVAINEDGSVTVLGSSDSGSGTPGAYQVSANGMTDYLVVHLDKNLQNAIAITFLGSAGMDTARHLIMDAEGNSVITGTAQGADFPLTDDAYDNVYDDGTGMNHGDVTISVLDPHLTTLTYSTYLGRSGWEASYSMFLTGSGLLYVSGFTDSDGFPETMDPFLVPENSGIDGFVTFFDGFNGIGSGSKEPLFVMNISAFADSSCNNSTSLIDISEIIYIQASGVDSNGSTRDYLRVAVNFSSGENDRKIVLRETGLNTGIYRGKFVVPDETDYLTNLTFFALMQDEMRCVVRVDTPARLNDFDTQLTVNEHEPVLIEAQNIGYGKDIEWRFTADCDWISFDETDHIISGLPDNGNVGTCSCSLTLEDKTGKTDSRKIVLTVNNLPPKISTKPDTVALEGIEYVIDFSSDEDGEEGVYWTIDTNASWFSFDSKEGSISGLPSDVDVGSFRVCVEAADGNGGFDRAHFNLSVRNVNDPPVIIGDDVTRVSQGVNYIMRYQIGDPDIGDRHSWSIVTDARWLSMDAESGRLSGTPGPEDVSVFFANLSVIDLASERDWRNISITVENVNDAPYFTEVPSDSSIISGKIYAFDIEASDYDGQNLSYSLETDPKSDMEIDRDGVISWNSSVIWFEREPYELKVLIRISDGVLKTSHSFIIEVIPTAAPNASLKYPQDGKKTSILNTVLQWTGSDIDGEEISYDVYLSESQASIISLKKESMLIERYRGTEIEVSDLEPGKKYYWTAIPYAGGSYGSCSDSVWSFVVNKAPRYQDPENQKAFVGSRFSLKLAVTDEDPEDGSNLRYKLDEAPYGMTIGQKSGLMRWTPGKDQRMLHIVVVNVTDGVDSLTIPVTVEVFGGRDDKVFPWYFLLLLPFLIVPLIVGSFIIRKRMRISDSSDVQKTDSEMETPNLCDVPLSPTEAHAHLGKGSKPVTYEELYGSPRPEIDERPLTTKELKEYISTQIEELERTGKVDPPNGPTK